MGNSPTLALPHQVAGSESDNQRINSSEVEREFSVLTFNVLAPCYSGEELTTKLRVSSAKRNENGNDASEREFKEDSEQGSSKSDEGWRHRMSQICHYILEIRADLVCLQEYWFASECTSIFEKLLGKEYEFSTKQRQYGKQDGLCILMLKESVTLVKEEGLDFSWAGDRVAQLVQCSIGSDEHMFEFVLTNVHHTYPHNGFDRQLRAAQCRQTISFSKEYVKKNKLSFEQIGLIIAGDFNGCNDNVGKELQDADFISCFGALENFLPVTHLTHSNREVCADFQWLYAQETPLQFHSSSWSLLPKDAPVDVSVNAANHLCFSCVFRPGSARRSIPCQTIVPYCANIL
eukprot:TRINITY_DN650_c0_g1_i4.p1 TRINITY_DN650_c0_g1~~TRINITY_DN650_c0_g1_i4.p1  ORF type:complete len:347 (-),score=53.32 TRINITY_DN650_c0_g1_i4:209-1249(-)